MKIALVIYLMYYLVECMTSSVISFAYFSHFFKTSISLEPMRIFVNGKRRLKPLVEFYAINLKNQGVKI